MEVHVNDRVKVYWPPKPGQGGPGHWCEAQPSVQQACPLNVQATHSLAVRTGRFYGTCIDTQTEMRTSRLTSQRYKVRYDDGQA